MAQDPVSERIHRQQIEKYALLISRIYQYAVNEFVSIFLTIPKVKQKKIFSFADYPITNERVKKELSLLYGNLLLTIENGATAEWYNASKKKDTLLPLDNIYNYQNRKALEQFKKRVESGLSLSNRVWNYKEQFIQEVEVALSDAIERGVPAKEVAKTVKSSLKEPDKLFRRVRDKFGVLQLSKKAQAYSPGQGVYRSSYKNALRLTRTEINMAYRASDHFRWSNDRSVIGFEIKLSNRHLVRDICDDLKGKYPKGFLFKGWHPQCLCYKVPILMNDSDFDKLQQSILDGEELPESFQSKGEVKQVPKNFKEWVESNKEKSKQWKSKPFFIADNFNGSSLDGGLSLD